MHPPCRTGLLLSLFYSRLTGGSYTLLPIGTSLSLERLLWWAVLSASAWTVGATFRRLLRQQNASAISIAAGTTLACALVCSTLAFAHHIDPGNEDKIFRVVLSRPTAVASMLLGATAVLLHGRNNEDRIATLNTQSPTITYVRFCQGDSQPIKSILIAGVSFGVGVTLYYAKLRVGVASSVPSQLFFGLCIFVIPGAALEWASCDAKSRRAWFLCGSSQFAALGLMGIAAFL